MMSAARYTQMVTFGRNFLWLLIAGVVALVMWIASDNTGERGKRLVFTPTPQMASVQNVMEKPHYQGLDARNRPYTVIAEQATQLDADKFSLDAIRADMMQHDGKWVALNAKTGIFDNKSKQLDLTGDVRLFYEGGYEMISERAQVDIPSGSAYGDSHVDGQGPAGTLEANGFHVFERGKIIRFDGSVKMRIYQ